MPRNNRFRAELTSFGLFSVNWIIISWASQMVLVVKYRPASAGDVRDAGSIPGWGRSPGGELDNALPYSCLKNAMGRGTWKATAHRVAKSQTRLK